MNQEPTRSETDQPEDQFSVEELVATLIKWGWGCVAASAVFLAVSIFAQGPDGDIGMVVALSLTVARIFGIGGFIIGLIAIFNHRWNHGSLLIVLSVGLPFLSIIFHGTL